MDWFRLDSMSPAVAERFRTATPRQRCEAVRIACHHAATAAGLAAPAVSEALTALLNNSAPDASLRKRLEGLATDLDQRYFELQERRGAAAKHEALEFFSKARAAAALAFALTADSAQLHEAIYEALSSLDDRAALEGLVEQALR